MDVKNEMLELLDQDRSFYWNGNMNPDLLLHAIENLNLPLNDYDRYAYLLNELEDTLHEQDTDYSYYEKDPYKYHGLNAIRDFL